MKHPTLRSSVFYIAVALVGTTLKMPPIYLHFPPVCYDSDFVWLMYPVIVDWVLIAMMLTLTALTIHQLHRLDVKRKRMVKQQDSESTKGREAEFKITVVGITSSLLSIVCEGLFTILVNVDQYTQWLPNCQFQHSSFIAFLINFLNNVFNFPIYYLIFNNNCINDNFCKGPSRKDVPGQGEGGLSA